jgi:hypothetical protein
MAVTVNVVGETSVSVSVAASTSVSVVASGGIGPAGFITAPGTSTNAFGTFQLVPGDGITVSTANGQFLISSYSTATVASLAPVQSVAGRTGSVVLQASDVTAGTFAIGRIPTISYTALSNVPTTFAPSAHTHSTTDVVSFTAAASAAAPVQSVQSRTGAVVLTRADITAAAEVHTHSTADVVGLTAAFSEVGHTHSTASIVSFTAAASAAAPVQSVQSRTGAVVLTRADITAAAEIHTHGTADIVSFTAAAAAASPVQSVQSRTGAVVITREDLTAAAEVHTHGTADVVGLTAAFSQVGHSHSTTDVISFAVAAAAVAPVQSVQSRTGAVVLTRADLTAAAEVHTHSTADVVGLTAAFAQVGHTHSTTDIASFTAAAAAAAPVQSVAGRTGVISLAAADVGGLANVATSGSYTHLDNVPLTFAPSAHTHSTSDITGYQGLPAQAGYVGPLVTDGTNATWTNRYSIVNPVLVQGAGMTFTRDTAAGEITIAFAGGTSGIVVGSATPQPLGVAASGSSANASREDHVHTLPTVGDITAAAAVHTHAASDIQSGTLDYARIPTIPYTGLSGVPVTFAPAPHTHDASALPANVASLNGLTGTLTIAAGSNVTVSTAGSSITIAAGGGGGGSSEGSRALNFLLR